MLKDSEE